VFRRSSKIAVALVVGALGIPGGSAQAASGEKPDVICVVNPAGPWGAYRYRPHRCDLHVFHVYPVAGYSMLRAQGLRWRSWGRYSAVAVGRVAVSTAGLRPLKLRLTQPRDSNLASRWRRDRSQPVFTVASGALKVGGSWRRFRVPIDRYLIGGLVA
jgi:hypothetical protein